MPIDLTALAEAASKASALSNLLLVDPQSFGGIAVQPPASSDRFLFHYEGENTVTLESDITDHFVENNTALQDQISLKPELITTHGYIGELNDVLPPALEQARSAIDKLTILAPYQPTLLASALIASNEAAQAYQIAALTASVGVAALATVTNALGGKSDGAQTKQQKAFSKFYGYWQKRMLFTVQTPWARFTDMAIKTLRAVQDEETRMVSDFEITFKKMKFTSSLVTNPTAIAAGRAANMASNVVDNGVSTPNVFTALTIL